MRLVEIAACAGKACPVRRVDTTRESGGALEPQYPTQPLRGHADLGGEHLDQPAATELKFRRNLADCDTRLRELTERKRHRRVAV